MKRLRVRAARHPKVASPVCGRVADSPVVEESRLLEGNHGGQAGPTMLFSVDAP